MQGHGVDDALAVADPGGRAQVGVEFAHTHQFAPKEEIQHRHSHQKGEVDVLDVEDGIPPELLYTSGIDHQIEDVWVLRPHHLWNPLQADAGDADGGCGCIPKGLTGDFWPHSHQYHHEIHACPHADKRRPQGDLEHTAGQSRPPHITIGKVGDLMGQQGAGGVPDIHVIICQFLGQHSCHVGPHADEMATECAERVQCMIIFVDERLRRRHARLLAEFIHRLLNGGLIGRGRAEAMGGFLAVGPVQEVAQGQQGEGQDDESPPDLRIRQQAGEGRT